jgi:protein-tyrosine phosphatase
MRFPRFSGWLDINAAGGRARWFPIEDGGVAPDDEMTALVAELAAHLMAGRSVVAHCGAGIGRTSLACGLTLVLLGGTDLGTALAEVRTARSGAGPENPVQVAHLERMALRLASG